MIDECKHCGSDEGYYIKSYVNGSIITRFNFDGSEAENDDMYDHLSHKDSKYTYCLSCNKRLFKVGEN